MDTTSIIIIVAVVAIVVLVIVVKMLTKKAQTRCPKCKEKYDYENDVQWKVVSTRHTESGKFLIDVDFLCRCGHCGHEQQFQRSFSIDHTNAMGDTVHESLDTVIRNFFS